MSVSHLTPEEGDCNTGGETKGTFRTKPITPTVYFSFFSVSVDMKNKIQLHNSQLINFIYIIINIYVGISAESPILSIPDEIPIYRNLLLNDGCLELNK